MAGALLDPVALRSSEDAFVDRLFEAAPRAGAPMLVARFPRAYVDLNRKEDELDPALIAGVERVATNPRIAAGLGVIPRVVGEGRAIQAGKISMEEAQLRLRQAYRPFHKMLEQILLQQRRRFGSAILFDCHSMPHDALSAAPLVHGRRPDVILGDRFGASCGHWLIDAAMGIFTAEGFAVARNAPFAGGFITQHYGKPVSGIHALQIEIDRKLYMDERTILPHSGFREASERLARVVVALAQVCDQAQSLAAE
ncbi:N-formylglutamate amidohydrolase [Algicella marina]|nr:N-formylglutamate amidohydrolase [Algicella marina]